VAGAAGFDAVFAVGAGHDPRDPGIRHERRHPRPSSGWRVTEK
jgi:hypothetical protein